MKLLLARHGETDFNQQYRFAGQSQTMLTEQGREQARQLGEALSPLWSRKIITSPLYRALETAELAAKTANYEEWISIDSGLQETGLGDFEGKSTEEVMELCVQRGLVEYQTMQYCDIHIMKRDLRKPLEERCGFEPLKDIDARLQRVIEKTIAREAQQKEDRPIVLVAHGGVNAYLLEKIVYGTCGINIDLRENGGHFPQRNDEISFIDITPDGKVVRSSFNIPFNKIVDIYYNK